jgi:hypothetical protein
VTTPLVFEDLPLSRRERAPFTLSVAAHHTVAVLGDEDSGIGNLGAYALGLETPAAGRVRVFDIAVDTLSGRDRLAFRRRVGYLPAGDGCCRISRCATTSPCRCGSAVMRALGRSTAG